MSNREWKLLLASPTACRVIAIIFLGMCVTAVVFNIYNASGGYIGSFSELMLYFGKDEIIISVMGLVLFVAFMYAGHNAVKMKELQEDEWDGQDAECEEIDKTYYGDTLEETITTDEVVVTEPFKSHTITFEGTTVTFKAPTAFKKMEDEEPMEFAPDDLERFADITFTTEDVDMFTCYLHAPHAENYANAEEYVKYNLAGCSDVKEKDKKLEHTVLNGRICYYYIVRYKNKFGKFQDLCAACDVGDGKIYAVEVDRTGWEKNLILDEVECFFTLFYDKRSM